MNYLFDYLVVDERCHDIGLEAGVAFATNELDEAILVANEVGVRSVVVEYEVNTGWHRLVYDARHNAELALRP